MKARALIGAVVLLAACASSSSGLRFPPGTPSWIRQNTIRAAKGLGDPHPASVSVTRGRYTIVVLTGKFTCFACSPSNSYPPPRGTVAVYRLDTQTHDAVDFGLCRDRASCVSNLCDGGCTVAKYGLDAAFSALYSHTQARGEVDFDHKVGFHHDCGLQDPAAEYGVIKGNCRVFERVGPMRIVVTFIETWHGLDGNGRRTSKGPLRQHIWRVFETGHAWVQSFSSTGDPPPQFEPCSARKRPKAGPAAGLPCPGRAR